MSRIALRCALATAFTALSGIAVVYSGDREHPVLRSVPLTGAQHLDGRAQSDYRSLAEARGAIEARTAAEVRASASRTIAPAVNAEPGNAMLIKVSRDLPTQSRRAQVTNAGREPAPASASAGVPLVSIAEALHVRFQGFTELSGVYRINEDDTISVPGIGRIELSSMPAEQLEGMLSKRILSLTGRDSSVSIEVDRYRHVFVNGDVDKAGSFHWFRGMTVLKALSLAGGFARQDAREEAEDKGDMVTLQLARTLSRHARLNAEMAGKTRIDVPERLIGLCGQQRSRELINSEESLLGVRRGSRMATLKAIEAGTTASAAEIARLKELQVSLDVRYGRFNEHVQSLERAQRNNVVTKQRVMDVETTLAELNERRAGAKVQLARAVAEEVQLVRQRIELEEVYRARVAEELSETWAKIEELQLELDKSRPQGAPVHRERVLLEPAVLQGRATPVDSGGDGGSTFTILRRQADVEVRVAARDVDPVRPGDMVIVARGGSGEGPSVVRYSCGGTSGRTKGFTR